MKRTPLKRSNKPLKRTPLKRGKKKLRRESPQPMPRLRRKANRALQDWYRNEFVGEMCEVCDVNQFDVMHHFIIKSQSFGLRFDEINLIFICNSCHYKHHRTDDATIHGTIQSRRGDKWFNALKKKKLEVKGQTESKGFYKEMIKKYEICS